MNKSLPTLYEWSNTETLHLEVWPTCDPRDVRRICPAEPVGADPVVKAERVEPDLEGTHVQGSVRAARVLVSRRLREQRRGAVAAGLRQDLLGKLEHEVG